ncbi:DUF1877 family protein [Streptomyces sp. NPDC032940]|uniref:DUF1877 family protein n=1 Tax=Streptomyces sp. NPDC032940 TaxID=3155366 RepID=UPI0033F6B705
MSIHLHLRAVAESEIQDDHAWLAEFMWEAWEKHAEEYASGVAESIDKVWDAVNGFYAASDALPTGTGKLWSLPIYGGRPVPHSAGTDPSDPPMMLLEPSGVSQAAGFLAGVCFEELWRAAGAKLVRHGEQEEAARQEILDCHEGLQAFYGRAAAAGHAVVKVVWA